MGYIGNRPADSYTSFAVQHFTTSATTTYSLDNPVANENEIALFINNVRQEPGSSYAYTASGTTLTLSAATSASDTMYCVFIGKAVQTVTPASGSVTNDMISYPLTESGATISTFNRTTSDGTILDFQKDGTSVGSVVAESGDLIVGNGDTALRYNDALNAIYPANASTGASLDNTLNLGWSSVKWSNLYMGGNIYLGGTGSANALDDYEEGTFTPTLSASSCTFSYSNQAGYYTKIGRMVHYVIYLKGTGTGTTANAVQIAGLPFTSLNASLYEAPAATWNSVSAGDARPIVNTNNTSFSIYYAGTTSQAVVNDTQDKYLLLQGSYETN